MFFRRKKSPPKDKGEVAPQEDAEQPWRLYFGLSFGTPAARLVRKPVAPADDPAAGQGDASPQG